MLRGFLLFEILLPLKNQTPSTHKCLQITGREGGREEGKAEGEGGAGVLRWTALCPLPFPLNVGLE